MRQLSRHDLLILISELAGLSGFYIDKFYEERENTFRFSISGNKVHRYIRCILPYALNETKYIEKTEEPTSFAMAVRKRITGFMIDGIEQYHDDRIMLMRLHKGPEQANVIMEMFGKGNFIITDSAMKILLAYKPHRFQDRAVMPGQVYEPPKNAGQATAKVSTQKEVTGSLQEALDLQYQAEGTPQAAKDKESEGIRVSIEKQKAILEKIEQEIRDNKAIGDAIFKELAAINALIDAARSDKRATKEQLQQLTKSIKILEVNLKDKAMTIGL